MAYAIMWFGRIKRTGLAHTYRHNSREDMPPNADPARTAMNRELIGSGGTTYRDLFEDVRSEMLIESPDFGKRKIRSDAAYGLEVLMTFSSRTDGVDLEKWIQRNVEWLNESFNPPGREAYVHDYDGTKKTIHLNNVRSVILHQDEGIPHLHAFIIPVDEKGVLNASYYIGGMQRCSRLQSSYAEKMHPLGLERGEERSPASHKNIGRYHNRINKAVSRELPEPMRGESLEEFRKRGNACLQDAELTYLSERTRLEQEVVKAQAAARRMNAENQAVHKQMERIAEILGCDRINEEAVRVLRKRIERQDRFERVFQLHPDDPANIEVMRQYNELLRIEREEERRRKRRQEEHMPQKDT